MLCRRRLLTISPMSQPFASVTWTTGQATLGEAKAKATEAAKDLTRNSYRARVDDYIVCVGAYTI
jgi:hypothetical protein